MHEILVYVAIDDAEYGILVKCEDDSKGFKEPKEIARALGEALEEVIIQHHNNTNLQLH